MSSKTPKAAAPLQASQRLRATPTASQTFEANDRADLAAPPAAAVVAMVPDSLCQEVPKVNPLALWYNSLTDSEQSGFFQAMQQAGIGNATFWMDANEYTLLSKTAFYRLDWYRAWFLAHGCADLFIYIRAHETDSAPHACPDWESQLDAFCRESFAANSGSAAWPMTEFYHTTTHGLGQLVRLISEYSQRELNPQRKPMWQALRSLIHHLREG